MLTQSGGRCELWPWHILKYCHHLTRMSSTLTVVAQGKWDHWEHIWLKCSSVCCLWHNTIISFCVIPGYICEYIWLQAGYKWYTKHMATKGVLEIYLLMFFQQGQSRDKATMPSPLSKVKAVLINWGEYQSPHLWYIILQMSGSPFIFSELRHTATFNMSSTCLYCRYMLTTYWR